MEKMGLIRQKSALSLALSLAVMVVMMTHAADVCDKCDCLPYEDNLVISCKGFKNHMPNIDLELIEWPKSEEMAYKAFFNNLSIHLLPK